MPLSWFVALRFLKEGRAQTLLIVAGVGVGVAVLVFLSALIDGLQQSLIDKGNQIIKIIIVDAGGGNVEGRDRNRHGARPGSGGFRVENAA